MSDNKITLHWFRQDLRLADNPALLYAAAAGKVLPIYILDDSGPASERMGAAAQWWAHHSLASLNQSLGGKLNFYRGEPAAIIADLVQRHKAAAVFWNRCYEPRRVASDRLIKAKLKDQGIAVESFNGSLLWEPWQVLKSDGTPYRVFTPFYRKGCLSADAPRQPLPPAVLSALKDDKALSLNQLDLLPKINWDKKLSQHWDISEAGAEKQLAKFLQNGLKGYKEGRNFPAKSHISRLSPYLHSGEISPNQVWHAVRRVGVAAAHAQGLLDMQGETPDIDHFCSELGWREFSYSLLYHEPSLPQKNWQEKFDHFPWRDNPAALKRWQQGLTGYPIVDAGMRELWQTGFMHNRVRMIVASFLTKNLMIDWRHGAHWFWDCLVDADLANNSASWQWVAGCGADAAPYFRIFNPITQGEKFDGNGNYTRHYVPELAKLPDRYLFRPWEAPAEILQQAGIVLGETYPMPIIDAAQSRTEALAAFSELGSYSL
jgi:deoxyribodipyrimidine photo-lyase